MTALMCFRPSPKCAPSRIIRNSPPSHHSHRECTELLLKQDTRMRNLLRRYLESQAVVHLRRKEGPYNHRLVKHDFSKLMPEEPAASEVFVFSKVFSKSMTLQEQLDDHYHSDTFLRDRLLTVMDIPWVQTTFRDRMLQSSQQDVNRIANQLSYKAHSAEISSAFQTQGPSLEK